jgi:uncharacterized protein (DUF1697 family)
METWIALFRGINVGGNNILPMAALRKELESLKLTNVRTYIQSGNVVFNSSAKSPDLLGSKISKHIELHHGFRPQVLIISQSELKAAIEKNPFREATTDPKSLHFYFLSETAAAANISALDQLKTSTEQYKLIDRVFYLYAPDGIGRSKLAAKAEKQLGVVTTARNYRTVEKLLLLANTP